MFNNNNYNSGGAALNSRVYKIKEAPRVVTFLWTTLGNSCRGRSYAVAGEEGQTRMNFKVGYGIQHLYTYSQAGCGRLMAGRGRDETRLKGTLPCIRYQSV